MLSLILGWDGLGVTSYLLVIYYSRWKRGNAGILTALINRVGDVIILISIASILLDGGYNFNITAIHSSGLSVGLCSLIFVASLTKRAQIPFSAWLPAAMAAPTPVSSLVHSSTLVTAGVYLLIRYQTALSRNAITLSIILFIGTATMIMAGAAALVETDMKKIVALSTLRQLGLIVSAIGLTQWLVAFFHMITHAFTKALLFIRVGNLIHSSNDYQDIRQSKVTPKNIPLSSSLLVCTNLSLRGFPFLAGFYSKDIWLESSPLRVSPVFISALFIVAVRITCLYSTRLVFFLIVRKTEAPTLRLESEEDMNFKIPVSTLWVVSLVSGASIGWVLFRSPSFLYIPSELKIFTLKVILIRALLYFFFREPIYGFRSSVSWVSKRIWGLPLLSSRLPLILRMAALTKMAIYLEKRGAVFYLIPNEGLHSSSLRLGKSQTEGGANFAKIFFVLAGLLVINFL